MESLGPFAVLTTNVNLQLLADVTRDGHRGTEYKITGPDQVIQLCGYLGTRCTGRLSPTSTITLDLLSREEANIPPNATFFAYAYPVYGFSDVSNDKTKEIDYSDPRFSFIAFGGFIYFNGRGKVVRVTSVAQGKGLYFDPPQKLSCVMAMKLKRENRLEPITISQLSEPGLTHFCWLAPDENFTEDPDDDSNTHGAFCYIHKDADKHQVFTVKPKPDADSDDENNDNDELGAYAGASAPPLSNNRKDSVAVTPYSAINLMDLSINDTDTYKQLTSGDSNQPKELARRLSSVMLCKICLDENIKVVFLPCRHMATCSTCAVELDLCPMCRCKIETKIDVFL